MNVNITVGDKINAVRKRFNFLHHEIGDSYHILMAPRGKSLTLSKVHGLLKIILLIPSPKESCLTPGITRPPARLSYMRAAVSRVGCMPLLDCAAANAMLLSATYPELETGDVLNLC